MNTSSYPSQRKDRYDYPLFGFNEGDDVYWVGTSEANTVQGRFLSMPTIPLTVYNRDGSSYQVQPNYPTMIGESSRNSPTRTSSRSPSASPEP